MEGPMIVCGLGQVGYRVANLLLAIGEPFVVVTDQIRAEWRRQLEDKGVPIFDGDARDEQLLHKAGLMQAKALIACTSHDLTNIEMSLDAKRLRPDLPIIARMFDQNLAAQLASHLGIQNALAMSVVAAPAFASAAFGDHLASEFEIEGQRLVVFRLDVQAHDPFVGWKMEKLLSEYGLGALLHIPQDGQLVEDPSPDAEIRAGDIVKVIGSARSIRKLRPEFVKSTQSKATRSELKRSVNPFAFFDFVRRLWKNTSVELRAVSISIVLLIVVSVFVFSIGMNLSMGDALYFVITTVTTTGYGDISPKDASIWLKLYACLMMGLGSASIAVLYSIVTDYIVTARLQQLVGGQKVPESGHVIVAGIGDVGYRVVEELDRMGATVVAVDSDAAGKYLSTIRQRVPVIVGDARDQETLRRAGGEHSIATIACTDDDAVNLSIGLASESLCPESRSVLRLFDSDFAQKVQTILSIDAAMSASRIAAPVFVSAALHKNSITAFVLRGRLFSIVDGESEAGGWSLGVQPDGRVVRSGTGRQISVGVRPLSSEV
jgi:Trk K+ transport system NAD-binding subunit